MKLTTQRLLGLVAALSLPSASWAADCTAEDQVFPWDQKAVDMMWSMRAWGCQNAWWENTSVVPQGNWCFSGGAPCWNGWWWYYGHPSQQACWDVLEQIVDQCMWSSFLHTTNGGTWHSGGEYSEGWFYNVNSKRDALPDDSVSVANATRTVYLEIDDNGSVTGVAHDIRRAADGFTKDHAFKA